MKDDAPHPEFVRWKRKQKLAAAEAKLATLKRKQYPGDELSAYFPLGTVGSAGRPSRRLNARRNKGIERVVSDSVEITRLEKEIRRLTYLIEQPAPRPKPIKAPKQAKEPTERERLVYAWYYYGTIDQEPPVELTEAELQTLLRKYRTGMPQPTISAE